MTKVITTRVEHTIAERIKKAATKSQVDKASFMRILIVRGLENMEQDELLKEYKKGAISLGKLSDELGITKWDALSLLEDEGIHLNYDERDLFDDLGAV